jgi:hypothetical protein
MSSNDFTTIYDAKFPKKLLRGIRVFSHPKLLKKRVLIYDHGHQCNVILNAYNFKLVLDALKSERDLSHDRYNFKIKLTFQMASNQEKGIYYILQTSERKPGNASLGTEERTVDRSIELTVEEAKYIADIGEYILNVCNDTLPTESKMP